MSRVIRHKHVVKEMMDDDYSLPTEQQLIVRVTSSRGNNLHEVESPQEDVENFLVSMPTKFRKNIWVKRGDFLLVDTIEEGGKVKAEICKIFTPELIKEYTKAGIWPKKFTKKRALDEVEDEGSNDDEFLVRNLNRPVLQGHDDDENEDESTSDED